MTTFRPETPEELLRAIAAVKAAAQLVGLFETLKRIEADVESEAEDSIWELMNDADTGAVTARGMLEAAEADLLEIALRDRRS